MERQIKHEEAEGPQGKWQVSTIRTDAGGAPVRKSLGSPFSSADFVDETPWPFETMVFKGGAFGHHHRAYKSREDALVGHDEIVAAIKVGTLDIGMGIRGPFGAPSLTPEEWRKGITQGPNMQDYDPLKARSAIEQPST